MQPDAQLGAEFQPHRGRPPVSRDTAHSERRSDGRSTRLRHWPTPRFWTGDGAVELTAIACDRGNARAEASKSARLLASRPRERTFDIGRAEKIHSAICASRERCPKCARVEPE